MRELVRASVVPGDHRKDAGRRRIVRGGIHAVEDQVLDRLERIGRAIGYRRPRRGERLVWNWRAVEVAAVPLQREIIDSDAADQREHRRELDTVFDRSRESVEVAVSNIGFHRPP